MKTNGNIASMLAQEAEEAEARADAEEAGEVEPQPGQRAKRQGGDTVDDVAPAPSFRDRVLRRYCSVHIGNRCEMGERIADTAVDVTAEWLEEMAGRLDMRDVDPANETGRFLRALAREIRR